MCYSRDTNQRTELQLNDTTELTIGGLNFYVGIVSNDGILFMAYSSVRFENVLEDLMTLAMMIQFARKIGTIVQIVMVPALAE